MKLRKIRLYSLTMKCSMNICILILILGHWAYDSEEIIYGETTKLRYYMDWFGMCHTKADIKVLRSFKGILKKGK